MSELTNEGQVIPAPAANEWNNAVDACLKIMEEYHCSGWETVRARNGDPEQQEVDICGAVTSLKYDRPTPAPVEQGEGHRYEFALGVIREMLAERKARLRQVPSEIQSSLETVITILESYCKWTKEEQG